MQPNSSVYSREMRELDRDNSRIRIRFGIEDLDAAETSSFKDNGHLYYSRLASLVYQTGVPKQSYATLEKNRMRANGRQLIPSRENPLPQGYVSRICSGEDGVFQQPPIIEISFSKTHSCPGLTFVFDATTGTFPAEITAVVSRGGRVLNVLDMTPDAAEYVHVHELVDFDAIKLIFRRTTDAFHRARMQYIAFGIGALFENPTVVTAEQVADIDPIVRRLEDNTFAFTIVNLDGMYNPDSPQKIWEYIEDKQVISVDYGQKLRSGLSWDDMFETNWADVELSQWDAVYRGGYVEWISGGRYVLNGEPSVVGIEATFTARSRLMDLTDPYHKGRYRPAGISLYDLAVEVLEDADIPSVYEGQKPYKLDVGLKSIMTVAPIPKTSHRECLQLIAHAAGMVVGTDRDGVIYVCPICVTPVDHDMYFDTQFDWPEVSKIKPLGAVSVDVYSYSPAVETRELHKATYGAGSYIVEHDFAVDITVAGAASYHANSGSTQFTVAARGEVIVSGKPLESSTTKIKATTGKRGATEEIENPLITDFAVGKALAEHIRDYLILRTTYEFDYRGSPEIEAMDIIRLQSRFDKGFAARLLRHQINFDGALSGHVIAKRMVYENEKI